MTMQLKIGSLLVGAALVAALGEGGGGKALPYPQPAASTLQAQFIGNMAFAITDG